MRSLADEWPFYYKNADHGQEWLEEAARRDDHMRSGILAELGCRLFEARRPAAAVEAFGRGAEYASKGSTGVRRRLDRST